MKAKAINNFFTYERVTKFIGYTLLIIIVASILYIALIFSHHYCAAFHLFSISNFGLFGDFIGGVIGTMVAVVAALYIIKSYKKQIEQGRKQSFEKTFVVMLELHRQNVQEIEILDASGNKLSGKRVFKLLTEELETLYNKVYKSIEEATKTNEQYQKWSDIYEHKKLAHELSHGFFFYDIDTYYLTLDKNDILYDICESVRQGLKKDKAFVLSIQLQRHTILGHYYRHLYNMVNWVDSSKAITFDEKQKYCKLIRSQLSDYEEILLYYNTLSPLGKDWNEPLGKTEVKEMNLICKYRLLKNCPYYLYYFGIKPTETYAVEDEAWRKKGELFFETDIRLHKYE